MISQGKKNRVLIIKTQSAHINICQLLKKIFFDYDLNLGLM